MRPTPDHPSIQVSAYDRPSHLRYDTADELPGIFAVRGQWIETLERTRCAYRTTDAFTGEHAGAVIENAGKWVKAGFDAVALALKARAEQLWQRAGGA